MSISGHTPFYLLAHRRQDGLIDFALMNPRGWVPDELVHKGKAARDEKQMLTRVEHLVPPWQDEIQWHWTDEPIA